MFTFYLIHVEIGSETKSSMANNESESLTNPPGGSNSEGVFIHM